MKKNLSIILVLLLSISLFAACGDKTPPASSPTSAPSSAPVQTDTVEKAALAYFENFDSAKVMKQAADFLAAIDAGDDMFILDIRQADAYEEGHIKGAVNMPYGSAVAEGLSLIPNDVQVYVYCYTGQTASQTIALLNVAGIYAANVQGGFNNGISKVEGFEAYVDTEAVAAPTTKYDVDADIQAAVTKYFSDIAGYAGTAFASINFKPASLKEVLDAEDDSYFVYDIRRADDYAEGHIPTAVNNPFGAGMQTKFSELPTDKNIIVQCYSGQTSSQTAAILRLLGYDAFSLQGGMGNAEAGTGWLGAGYEVVKD